MSVEKMRKKWQDNPMLKPRIVKVTVNMAVGKSGETLERATKVLEQLTGQRPCKRKAKQTIRDFGIRKGEPIACIVTLRKERAKEFLKKAFHAVDDKISKEKFDTYGNFSFGIREHIELPGTKYVPELGIHGLDVCVTLCRPGGRVKKRRRAKSDVGSRHKLAPEEAVLFIKEEFGVGIV